MTTIAKIDEDTISADDFIKRLKITNVFPELLREIISDKLTIQAAKQQGIAVSHEDVQERADQFRRVRGLHRAKDTNQYLDALGFSLDDFEAYIADTLYKEKMIDAVCNDAAIDKYFKLNSPKFESVALSHILLDSEGKAKELIAYLAEDPDGFAAMVKEHSLSAGTKESGGALGKVRRDMLPNEVEAKLFSASPGEILGPFPAGESGLFEIFKVTATHPAKLDEQARAEVRKRLYQEWLGQQAKEHKIEVL